MDEKQLEALAHDIEDLKRAIKRNAPLVQDVFDLRGWDIFSLAVGILVSCFTLGAHILCAVYGSFELIPAPLQAGLWAILAISLVGSAVVKLLIVARRSAAGENKLLKVMGSLLAGTAKHVYIPVLLLLIVIVAAALHFGHPWFALSGIGILMGLWCNVLALQYDQRSLLSLGYWGMITGVASLWWLESAPFLWSFIIFGGMFFVFAGAIRIQRGTKP